MLILILSFFSPFRAIWISFLPLFLPEPSLEFGPRDFAGVNLKLRVFHQVYVLPLRQLIFFALPLLQPVFFILPQLQSFSASLQMPFSGLQIVLVRATVKSFHVPASATLAAAEAPLFPYRSVGFVIAISASARKPKTLQDYLNISE